MKKTCTIFTALTLAIVLFSTTIFAQQKFVKNETVEQVSKSFIKGFQLQNYEALYELFPPKDEVIALYDAMLPNGPEKDTVLANLENVFSPRIYKYYQSEFNRILAKGKRAEIDWRRMKLIDVEYEVEYAGGYEVANPTYLTCKHRGSIYTIQIHSLKLNDGWYVLPLIGDEARIGYWADPIALKEFRAQKRAKKEAKREEKKLEKQEAKAEKRGN